MQISILLVLSASVMALFSAGCVSNVPMDITQSGRESVLPADLKLQIRLTTKLATLEDPLKMMGNSFNVHSGKVFRAVFVGGEDAPVVMDLVNSSMTQSLNDVMILATKSNVNYSVSVLVSLGDKKQILTTTSTASTAWTLDRAAREAVEKAVIDLARQAKALGFASAAESATPSLDRVLANLPNVGFGEPAEPIPATVVDVGVLKYVPYASHRVGPDRELNVYGDPEQPTCIEIGLYRSLLAYDEEKVRCLMLLQALFPEVELRGMSLQGGKSIQNGIVAEVTPPSAPDAYGGWWISVYSPARLRSEPGIQSSVSEVPVEKSSAPSILERAGWKAEDLAQSRPGSSRVYVKSYYRKDGTYVQAHSRKR